MNKNDQCLSHYLIDCISDAIRNSQTEEEKSRMKDLLKEVGD